MLAALNAKMGEHALSKKGQNETITKALEKSLGIGEVDAKALTAVLMGGNMTAGAVSILAGENLHDVEAALENLHGKGLVVRMDSVVPVYRGVSPAISAVESLAATAHKIRPLIDLSQSTHKVYDESLTTAMEGLQSSRKGLVSELGIALDNYESTVLEGMRTSCGSMIESVRQVFITFSQDVSTSFAETLESVDGGFVAGCSNLRIELEAVQKQLQTELDDISREFGQSIAAQSSSSLESMTDFGKKTKALAQKTKSATKDAIASAVQGFHDAAAEAAAQVDAASSGVADQTVAALTAVSQETDQLLEQFNSELDKARDDAQNYLAALVAQARELSGDVAGTARGKVEEAQAVIGSVVPDVDSWGKETGDFMNSAAQTVVAQLDQVSSTNAGYLDGMKSSIAAYLDRAGSTLGGSYSSVKNLSSECQAAMEKHVGDSNASLLKIMQALSSTNEERIRITSESLLSGLDKWIGDIGRNIEKKMTQAGKDVTIGLDAETKTFSSMTADIASRLSTALGTVVSDTAGKNKSLMTKARKIAREFETDVATGLSETLSQLASSAGSQTVEAKELYDSMNSLLDSHMTQSLSTLSSYSDKVQKQIDSTIDEQMARLESHAQGIREDFHAHIGEMTKEFLTAAQSMQAAFNGMLSSKSLETRDSLSSAQTEFKNAIKTEMAELQEGSVKIQQEYASGIAARVEEVTASHQAMKQSLEDITTKRQSDFSEGLADTLSAIEAVIADVEGRLKEIQSDTGASSSTSKAKSLLTKAKKLAREFEADVATRLSQTASQFASAAGSQAKQAKALYESLNSLLDSHLTQSVSTLSSYADRLQKQIDGTVDEEMARIETNALGIREDFHFHVEEITKQFLTMAENVESAFNGLLSGQSLETRDSLSSAQTEFKSAIRSELASLQEGSVKIQKEYASGLTAKVEQITASHQEMKKSLKDMAAERQSDLSQKLTGIVGAFEGVVADVDARLGDIQSVTIPQVSQELANASNEFSTSVVTTCDGMTSRIGAVVDATNEYLTKGMTGMRTTIETFATEQKDAEQGMVADVGKKLETLANKMTKDLSQESESYRETVIAKEEEAISARAAVEAELASVLDSRRGEAERALVTASTWMESTVNSVLSTLAVLGEKVKNEVAAVQQGLATAADDAETGIVQKTTTNIDKFEEAATALIRKVERSFRDKASGFQAGCDVAVAKGIKSVSSLPNSLSKKVRATMDQGEAGMGYASSGVLDSLSDDVSAYEGASKAAVEELSSEVVRFKEQLIGVRDSLLERIMASAAATSRQASEKPESTMTEAKTLLSGSLQVLTGMIASDAADRDAAVSEWSGQLIGQAEAAVSGAKKARNDSIARFVSEADESLQRWSTDQRRRGTELANKVEETLTQAESTVVASADSLEAVKVASQEMEKVSTGKTWYLTGEEETRAHILDMTQRAKESILISTVSSSILDIKNLAKVSDSVRRVLILPETEEPESVLQELEGWRIWSVTTPMLLAVMDDKEVLIGGAAETGPSLVLVSNDEAYLQLYHDILGPRLTNQRKRS
ncbi:MAG: hypothetical protein C4K49_11395 [Candidatus Thorarchaeota archaeon]|nr:MAG: hypothetical protein C4K49_11395 [Candidatus Thorarchaeota archaeon]